MASTSSSMKEVSLSLSFFLSVSHTPTHRCVLMWLKAKTCWETDWCVMKCLTTDLAEQHRSRGALEQQLAVNHRTAVSPNALDGVRLHRISPSVFWPIAVRLENAHRSLSSAEDGFLHRRATLSTAVFKRQSLIFNCSVAFDREDANIK